MDMKEFIIGSFDCFPLLKFVILSLTRLFLVLQHIISTNTLYIIFLCPNQRRKGAWLVLAERDWLERKRFTPSIPAEIFYLYID